MSTQLVTIAEALTTLRSGVPLEDMRAACDAIELEVDRLVLALQKIAASPGQRDYHGVMAARALREAHL